MPRHTLLSLAVLLLLPAAFGSGSTRAAGVIVVMNRTETGVPILLTDADRAQRRLALEPGELAPVHASGRVAVSFLDRHLK